MAPERDRPDDRRRPDVEFCVHGRPLSARTRRRGSLAAWRQQVRAVALAALPDGHAPYAVAVELRITLYAPRPVADMDNLIKPVQDALQGILYEDDRMVKDVSGNWRNIDAPFQLHAASDVLVIALGSRRQFMHIRLWVAPVDEDLG
ncbi:MAG TPA: RusA family crossover junction endodeoxyribonuclease [Acetobacteraceae bacterium]|nr:RusA family crossover junction endodeoxyribonuclease [Acetobacteraceae bacterium]